MPENTSFVKSPLKNPGIIEVNQQSHNARGIVHSDILSVWVSNAAYLVDRNLAVFNLGDENKEFTLSFRDTRPRRQNLHSEGFVEAKGYGAVQD